MFGLRSSPHGIANQARIRCRNFTSSILCQFLKRFLPVAMCLQSIQYIQDVPATPLCVSHQDAWPPVHKLGTLGGKQSSLQAPVCLLCRQGTPPCLPAPAYSKPHINIIFYQEPITLSKRSLFEAFFRGSLTLQMTYQEMTQSTIQKVTALPC